jgi:hypothetical protein
MGAAVMLPKGWARPPPPVAHPGEASPTAANTAKEAKDRNLMNAFPRAQSAPLPLACTTRGGSTMAKTDDKGQIGG